MPACVQPSRDGSLISAFFCFLRQMHMPDFWSTKPGPSLNPSIDCNLHYRKNLHYARVENRLGDGNDRSSKANAGPGLQVHSCRPATTGGVRRCVARKGGLRYT
jgi:hypothetical protein